MEISGFNFGGYGRYNFPMKDGLPVDDFLKEDYDPYAARHRLYQAAAIEGQKKKGIWA